MSSDFCDELNTFYKTDTFNGKTINYYINSFLDVLCLDIEKGNITWNGIGKNTSSFDNKEYITNTIEKKGKDYVIVFSLNTCNNKEWYCLDGNTEKIVWFFSIYNVTSMKAKEENGVLPVDVTLKYNYNDKEYFAFISQHKGLTSICFSDRSKSVLASILRVDFEIVLRIIMRFLEDPELIIATYKEISDKDKSYIISHYIDPGMVNNDTILDKNGKKYEKVLK